MTESLNNKIIAKKNESCVTYLYFCEIFQVFLQTSVIAIWPQLMKNVIFTENIYWRNSSQVFCNDKFQVIKPFLNRVIAKKLPFLSTFRLTHFMPLIFFYTPRKHQKTRGFLMFSGSIEWDLCRRNLGSRIM